MNNHPHVTEHENVALLLIDVINTFNFESGKKLFEQALPMAKNLSKLKKQAEQLNIPVLYVNDNYGKWQSDFPGIIEHVQNQNDFSKQIVDILKPKTDDYFILKPQFSGFYCTPLELLLQYLEVKTLIITGISGNMCVQFTANDAYMRGYKLYIPSDCTASNTDNINKEALFQMKRIIKADITSSDSLNLEKIKYKDT